MMRKITTSLAGLVLAAVTCLAFSQEPASVQEFAITPEVGAFTICAASYQGEMAAKLAHDLAVEVRTRYGLPAYVFNRGAELRQQQEAEIQRKREQQQQYLKSMGLQADMPLRIKRTRIEDQYAVLIGGFREMETARKELDRIKKLKPDTVRGPRIFLEVDPKSPDAKKYKSGHEELSPFTNSFVVRNPALPAQNDSGKPDPFWKELNAGETYSLLRCKKPWTLAVWEYQTTTVIQSQAKSSGFLTGLFGNSAGAELDANAMNAHNLAEGLRKMGFKSYVLHTRSTSIVTIGEFDSKDDPRMQEISRALGNNIKLDPKLHFFAKPMPMPVPRFEN